MSGYDSISDYAFKEFPVEDFNNFQDWIEALETDFLANGRAPLNQIFDQLDFNRIEIEWEKRKEVEDKEKKEQEALSKFVSLQEQWEKDVKDIVKDLPKDSKKKLLTKFKNKVSGFFKRLFR